MAAPVKWGIVSTANINRKVIPGAHASDKVDLVGVASRDQPRARSPSARNTINSFSRSMSNASDPFVPLISH